jgi:TolB-like protein
MSLFSELRRRNVFRVAAGYAVLSWLILQITDVLLDALELPSSHAKLIVVLLIVGAIPALIISWVYEVTPEGIRKESEIPPEESITTHTARKLDIAVIALLVLAIGMFGFDRMTSGGGEESDAEVAVAERPAEGVSPGASESVPLDASVAVLPFTTRSRDEDDTFFSDGVHDDLLTQLAKIGALSVISRTSVMEYRDTTKNMRQIGEELGVATIVEGAVQRSGNTVRITAQLIDTATDKHLWAETYDRELTAANLFAIQTEIATSIADALEATLSPDEREELGRQLTDDLAALEAYQRARRMLSTFRSAEIDQAIVDLSFAIQRDPEFAAAYALRSRNHMWRYWFLDADPSHRERAWADIQAAREISPDLPEADIAEGIYHYWGFLNYERALQVLEPALKAYPNDADLHMVISWVNRRYGQFDTALHHMRRGLELDPRNINGQSTLSETLMALGEYDEVPDIIAALDRIQPDHPRALAGRAGLALNRDGDSATSTHYWRLAVGGLSYGPPALWAAQMSAGDFAGASETAQLVDISSVQNGTRTGLQMKGIAMHMAGDPEAASVLQKARSELEAMLADDPDNGAHQLALCPVVGALADASAAKLYCEGGLRDILPDAFNQSNTFMTDAASGLAMAGEHERAFELLEAAIANRAGPRRNQLKLNPMFNSLHDNPRWDALIQSASP